MAKKLGIETKLKNLRHYNATELILAGVDPRTVGGRLGHGGGATTLRVYTAWTSEADQRAAKTISIRMPARPKSDARKPRDLPSVESEATPPFEGEQLYQRIAADLRGAIQSGILRPGDSLPTEKAIAARYGVAASTAHRAVSVLVANGHVIAIRGHRAIVAEGPGSTSPEFAAIVGLPHQSATSGRK